MVASDLVLYNAKVITLDPGKPRAELVAVKGGKIAWVGANDDLRLFPGREIGRIDCEGQTLIPGFNDAHTHILSFASSLLGVDCSSLSSIAEIQSRIGERAKETPRSQWIRAGGYNEFYLAEKRHPNRWGLDKAAPHHPVKLTHRSGHACVLNSLALSLAGISSETPEPPGGMIDRDLETGEPNGLLFGMDAFTNRYIPPLSEEELTRGVRLANQSYLAQGITSLQDATVHNGLEQWRMFQRLRERGELAPRVFMMVGLDALADLRERGFYPCYGDDGLRLGAVKRVINETGGALHPPQAELNEEVLLAHRDGFQVALHAIEESTVEAAVAALEHALQKAPRANHRHRIEHCSVCPPSLLERLKGVGAVVVTQPPFIYYSGERYLATVPPHQRRWLYRMRSFKESGLSLAASSDSPVAPLIPLVGIYAATTRLAETGQTLLPEESVSPGQALEMYTLGGAYASFQEGVKGSIAVGKLADLVLLSADPTQVPLGEIKEIRVEITIIGGEMGWKS